MLLLLRREIQISYYSLRKTKPSYNKQRNQIWRMFAACQLNRKKKSAVLWKERKERRPVASRNDLRPNQCHAGTPARPTSLPFSFLITEADLRLNKVLLPCIDESTVKLSDVMAPGQGGPHARAIRILFPTITVNRGISPKSSRALGRQQLLQWL